jgi:hypothetical protein
MRDLMDLKMSAVREKIKQSTPYHHSTDAPLKHMRGKVFTVQLR